MGLELVVIRTSANCNILRKVIVVQRQVGICTSFEGVGGGDGANFAHVLILICYSLYIFRSLRSKISVKPAVKCQAQSFISTWVPCYTQSARSDCAPQSPVTLHTSHIFSPLFSLLLVI